MLLVVVIVSFAPGLFRMKSTHNLNEKAFAATTETKQLH
jgi:hypothetical protein